MIILVLLATAISYTLYANFLQKNERVGAVGELAPDFVLKDLNGNEYQLSDYRGKGVFLNFWGTYCEPCKDEMPYMNKLYAEYKDQGVEILAINVGETDLAINTFASKYGIEFPIVVDVNGEVQHAYNIYPLPATFLVDSEGKIVKYYDKPMTEEMIREFMEQIKP